MNHLTEILQEYVATANNPDYGGNWEVINSKFPELQSYDKDVLQEYVETANNPSYGENWNIINGKFPEFFNPKKNKSTSNSPKINTSVNKKSKTSNKSNTDGDYTYEDLYGENWQSIIDEVVKKGPKHMDVFSKRHAGKTGYDQRFWNEDGSLKTADEMHDYSSNNTLGGKMFKIYEKTKKSIEDKFSPVIEKMTETGKDIYADLKERGAIEKELENKIVNQEGVVVDANNEPVEIKEYDGSYIISDEEESELLNITDDSLNSSAKEKSKYATYRINQGALDWDMGDEELKDEKGTSSYQKWRGKRYGNIVRKEEYKRVDSRGGYSWRKTDNVKFEYINSDGSTRKATKEEIQNWGERDYITKWNKKINKKINDGIDERNKKLLYKNPEEYLYNAQYHAHSQDVELEDLPSLKEIDELSDDVLAEGYDQERIKEEWTEEDIVFGYNVSKGKIVNAVYEDYKGKYRLYVEDDVTDKNGDVIKSGGAKKIYLDWEIDTPQKIIDDYNEYENKKLSHIGNVIVPKLKKDGKWDESGEGDNTKLINKELKKWSGYDETQEENYRKWHSENKYQNEQNYIDFNTNALQQQWDIIDDQVEENLISYYQKESKEVQKNISEDLTAEMYTKFEGDEYGNIYVKEDLDWEGYEEGDLITKEKLDEYLEDEFQERFSNDPRIKKLEKEVDQLYKNARDSFVDKWKPTYNLIGKDRLEEISSIYTATMKKYGDNISPASKKGTIDILWKRLEKSLTEEYNNMDGDAYGLADYIDQRKHEFYTYMFDESGLGLGTGKDGGMSDYRRQLILQTINDNQSLIKEKILKDAAEDDGVFDAGDYYGILPTKELQYYREGTSEDVEGYDDIGQTNYNVDKTINLSNKILDQETKNKYDVDSFWEGFTSLESHEYVPVVSAISNIQSLYDVKKLAEKPWEELSQAEKDYLRLYNLKNDSDQRVKDISSYWYGGGKLTAEMLPYVAEFVFTSPAFSAARVGLQKTILKSAIKRTGKQIDDLVLKRVLANPSAHLNNAAKFSSWFLATGAHTAANPQRYIEATMQNMVPEMALMMSEDGTELVSAVTKEGDNVLKAFAKGYGTTWAEFMTERVGEAVPMFGRWGGKQIGKLKGGKEFLERLVISRYLSKAMNKMGLTLDEAKIHFLKRAKDGIGWNGFLGEVFEETVNQPLSNLINGDDAFEGMDYRFFGELSVSMGTTSLAFGGLGMLASRRNKTKAGYSVSENGTVVTYKTKAEFNERLDLLEKQGKLNNPNYTINIDVNNDVTTFQDTEGRLSKYKDKNNKVNNVKKDFFDLGLASEIELTEEIAENQNDYSNLTTIEEQLNEKYQERQDILDSDISGRQKNKALRKNQKELKNLEQAKMDVINPYLSKVEKRKRFKSYKKITENVKDLNEKMKLDTQIIEKSTGEGTKKAILEDVKRQLLETKYGGQWSLDGKTWKNQDGRLEQEYIDNPIWQRYLTEKEKQTIAELEGDLMDNSNLMKGLEDNPHGMISKDGKYIFINKSSALAKNGGNINVAAHEFLHRALKTMIDNNPHTQLALGSAVHKYVMSIDPKQYGGDFNRRLQAYQDGSTQTEMSNIEQAWVLLQQNIDPATGEQLTASQRKNKEVDMKKLTNRYIELQNSYNNVMAEEALTLLSDAFAMGNLNMSNKRLSVLGKIFERILNAIGVRAKFENGEAVYDFVSEFTSSIQKGKVSRRLRKQLSQKAELKGQLKEDKITLQRKKIKRYQNVQFSKAVNKNEQELGLAANTPAIIKKNEELQQQILDAYENRETTRDKNGKIIVPEYIREKLVDNNMPRVTALAAQAANAGKNIELEQDKKKGFDQFFPEYYLKLVDLARTYNAEKVPFGAYMNNLLPLKYSGILKDLKKGEIEGTVGVSEATGIATEDTRTPEEIGKLIKLYKRFGDMGKVHNLKVKLAISKGEFDPAKENISRIGVNTIDLFPQTTQLMFGVVPKEGNLTQGDIKQAQMFINNYVDTIAAILPKYDKVTVKINPKTKKPSKIKSIGLPRKLLKLFYTKSEKRIGNDYIWIRDNVIDTNKLLKYVGITERTKPNLYKKDDNTSQSVIALMNLVGRMMTNQASREYFWENKMPLENMGTLMESMGTNMFSKSVNSASVGDKALFFAALPKLGENYKKHGNSMRKAFNMTYSPNLFGDKREDVIKDLENYIETYEQYVAEATLTGEPMLSLENYISEQTMGLTLEKNLSDIIGTNLKGAFKDKNKLTSARNAVSKVVAEGYVSVEQAERFLKFLAATGNIGGTTLMPNKKGDLVINEEHWQLKILNTTEQLEVAKAKKDKKKIKTLQDRIAKYTENIEKDIQIEAKMYGLFKGVEDLKTVVTQNVKRTGIEIPPNTPQNVNVKLNTKKDIQAQEDSSMRNKMFLRNFAEGLRSLQNEGKINQTDIGMILLALGNVGMSTPIAAAAKVAYTTPGVKTKSTHRYEHLIPRKIVTLYYANSIVDGSAQSQLEFDNLLDQFVVAIIPQEQDEIVNNAKYKDSMPNPWIIGMDPLMRYFNLRTFGKINLDLIDVKTGKPITKYQNFKKVHDILGENHDKAVMYNNAILASRVVAPSRGMSTFDFDETLIDQGENFIIATDPNTGNQTKITSANWPLEGPNFAAQGYEFDFTDFVNVRGGVKGPLFKKLQNQIKKYGNENVYVLTARPAESASAIHEWLKANNVDLPLENITGLGNSTGEAKAEWMLGKFAEGYNDMYFVDDALPNVKAVKDVLDQLDIKSNVQQARHNFSKSAKREFSSIMENATLDLNRILEQTKGVKAEARFSAAQAKIRGGKIGRYKIFLPPSAQDFKGLLYYFLGKGKVGERQMAFFDKALIKPFAKAISEINSFKQNLNNKYKAALKEFGVKKLLSQKVGDTNFTAEQAVRVYLWNKAGYEIPGLSKRDLNTLVSFVEKNENLLGFAETISKATEQAAGYTEPSEFWTVETILSDLHSLSNEMKRSDFLAEWKQNVDNIFSTENMNKIEALYGSRFREALEDMLYAMEFGTSREKGSSRIVNAFNNWANQSVGAIMFFNMRSALLQTISAVNFINWSDNNPLKAGMAFANQPQFWKDFAMIFNSDMLKQRRGGQQRGVNETELANAVAGSTNKAKAALNWLLTKGFLPTQIADSFAIASGGASFYRNRFNTYVKQGYSQEDAHNMAFQDFQENAEASQQSARPDMISQQQRSPLGRYILAFKNTPMQYARLVQKAYKDLINRRGDAKTNMSKIVYYMAVQNLIFTALQSALGSMIGDDEEDMMPTYERIANNMVDNFVGGFGIGGQAVVTVKGTIQEFFKQEGKDWGSDHAYTILRLFGLSPTIGSKGRKVYSAIQTNKFNKEVMEEMSLLNVDNPAYSIFGNLVSAVFNVPLDRLVKKVDNIDAAITEDINTWQRIALMMGWNTWDLGIKDQDILDLKEEIKEKKKIEKEKDKKKKKEEKKKEKEKEKIELEKENFELQDKEKEEGKDVICAGISKNGKRCKKKVLEGKRYCTVHEKVEKNESGEKVRCKKIKSDGDRCKMKTSSTSGYCYYHD